MAVDHMKCKHTLAPWQAYQDRKLIFLQEEKKTLCIQRAFKKAIATAMWYYTYMQVRFAYGIALPIGNSLPCHHWQAPP